MILDQIANAAQYSRLGPAWKVALSAMETAGDEVFAAGKQMLDKGVRLIPSTYETKAPCGILMEAHRVYADVMFLLEGEEMIYYKPTAALSGIAVPYDAEKDILRAPLDDDVMPVLLKPGFFVVFMPQEAQRPGCHPITGKNTVRKIVLKVPLE